ncbi:hypothetical protein HK104_010097 [Borealophlyctis nickersoniae]|nr:hypothetical protein HK104_010097 [Borealophlyctis nickersoniae]
MHSKDDRQPGYIPRDYGTKPIPPSVHERGLKVPGPSGSLTPSDVKEILRKKNPKKIICQRCHRLKYQNVQPPKPFRPNPVKLFKEIRVRGTGVVVVIVDVVDFPGSLLKDVPSLVGMGKKMILVGNKADLLPEDVPRQDVKKWLRKVSKGRGYEAWDDVLLVSAATGNGMFELVQSIVAARKDGDEDVFLVGCANVGKSAVVNAMRKMAGMDAGGSTTSRMPGTTVGMIPMRMSAASVLFAPPKKGWLKKTAEDAVEEEAKDDTKENASEPEEGLEITLEDPNTPKIALVQGTLYDTPGLHNPTQVTTLLKPQELVVAIPTRQLKARREKLAKLKSMFIGGLFRIDVLEADSKVRISVFVSSRIPLHPCKLSRVDTLIEKHLGVHPKMLYPPIGPERAKAWPKFERAMIAEIKGGREEYEIALAGLGWMRVSCAKKALIEVHSPGGVGAFIRPPISPPIVKKR